MLDNQKSLWESSRANLLLLCVELIHFIPEKPISMLQEGHTPHVEFCDVTASTYHAASSCIGEGRDDGVVLWEHGSLVELGPHHHRNGGSCVQDPGHA